MDTVGAFMVGPSTLIIGDAEGPLSGSTLGVKDLFDVAGYRTGGGNPDWLADASPASVTAPAVQRLAGAGATVVGKTHTDELAYSLAGTNVHYGTPVNVHAPGCIPGGSSSGSAAAVAAGLVDIGLGTDAGGSIRVPASYCGVFGLRPSWGRVPVDGVLPLSPSYDTVGVLARDAVLLGLAASALFGAGATPPPVEGLVVAEDAWALADGRAAAALGDALDRTGLPVEPIDLAGEHGGLEAWVHAFRVIQGAEAWAAWGEWITARRPELGPGIAGRFAAASRLTPEDVAAAHPVRRAAAARLRDVLDGRRLLVIPAASGPAPPIDASAAQRKDLRDRTLRLTCIAGHAGAPVVSAPVATVGGLPVGLAFVATPGLDEQALEVLETFA